MRSVKRQVSIDRHVDSGYDPVTPQPFAGHKVVIHLFEHERVHLIGAQGKWVAYINLVAVAIDLRCGPEAPNIHVTIRSLVGQQRQANRRHVHEQIARGDHEMLLQGDGHFEQGDAGAQIPQIKSVGADGDPLCDWGYDLEIVSRREDSAGTLSISFNFLGNSHAHERQQK